MNYSVSVDPRVERTRQAVIDAVVTLMADEGPGALTHQRVAELSGVGRSTLYRHWPTPGDLLYEAIALVDRSLFPPPYRASLHEWLREALDYASRELAQPAAIQLTAALIARAQVDEPGVALRDRVVSQGVDALTVGIAHANESGDPADPDPAELFTFLIGPLFLRVVVEGREPSPDFIERTVTHALASCAPARQPKAGG